VGRILGIMPNSEINALSLSLSGSQVLHGGGSSNIVARMTQIGMSIECYNSILR
jgi:hypothetical protein